MAEDKKLPKHESPMDDGALSRDDLRALSHVLHNVNGASPSSISLLAVPDAAE